MITFNWRLTIMRPFLTIQDSQKLLDQATDPLSRRIDGDKYEDLVADYHLKYRREALAEMKKQQLQKQQPVRK